MLRAITVTWDPDSLSEPDVALGLNVSVIEAHHVLCSAADAMEFMCPEARVSRNGVALVDELVAEVDEDDE